LIPSVESSLLSEQFDIGAGSQVSDPYEKGGPPASRKFTGVHPIPERAAPTQPIPNQSPNKSGSEIPKWGAVGALDQSRRNESKHGKAARPLRSQRHDKRHTVDQGEHNRRNLAVHIFVRCPL